MKTIKHFTSLFFAVTLCLTTSCGYTGNNNTYSNDEEEQTIENNHHWGTYVTYPCINKRCSRTFVLKQDGSATVTFKIVNEDNQTSTETEYGYWNSYDGYIKVVYDDGDDHEYLDLNEKMSYSTYNSYRSRKNGLEYEKID